MTSHSPLDSHLLMTVDSQAGGYEHRSVSSVCPPGSLSLHSLDSNTPASLQAANRPKVHFSGVTSSSLHFSSRKFHAGFLSADVSQPPLNADFLCCHWLLIEVANCCWWMQPFCTQLDSYHMLLAEFPSLTAPTFASSEQQHGRCHQISTIGQPAVV